MVTTTRRGLFVTGTDTGIGKTTIARAIAAAWRHRGFHVGVYKPVETGCTRRGLLTVSADAEALIKAAGGHQPIDQATSYTLRLPVAPVLAAEAAGVRIDPIRLTNDFSKLSAKYDLVLVEGAGGLLVPITGGFTYRDLVKQLALPVITVVGSRLGCINHTLLTLETLDRDRVRSHGYVVNCLAAGNDAAQEAESNRRVIGRFTDHRCLGVFPHADKKALRDDERLAELAERFLDIEALT